MAQSDYIDQLVEQQKGQYQAQQPEQEEDYIDSLVAQQLDESKASKGSYIDTLVTQQKGEVARPDVAKPASIGEVLREIPGEVGLVQTPLDILGSLWGVAKWSYEAQPEALEEAEKKALSATLRSVNIIPSLVEELTRDDVEEIGILPSILRPIFAEEAGWEQEYGMEAARTVREKWPKDLTRGAAGLAMGGPGLDFGLPPEAVRELAETDDPEVLNALERALGLGIEVAGVAPPVGKALRLGAKARKGLLGRRATKLIEAATPILPPQGAMVMPNFKFVEAFKAMDLSTAISPDKMLDAVKALPGWDDAIMPNLAELFKLRAKGYSVERAVEKAAPQWGAKMLSDMMADMGMDFGKLGDSKYITERVKAMRQELWRAEQASKMDTAQLSQFRKALGVGERKRDMSLQQLWGYREGLSEYQKQVASFDGFLKKFGLGEIDEMADGMKITQIVEGQIDDIGFGADWTPTFWMAQKIQMETGLPIYTKFFRPAAELRSASAQMAMELQGRLQDIFGPMARIRRRADRKKVTLLMEREEEWRDIANPIIRFADDSIATKEHLKAARETRELYIEMFELAGISKERFLKEYVPWIWKREGITEAFVTVPKEVSFFAEYEKLFKVVDREMDAMTLARIYIRALTRKKYLSKWREETAPIMSALKPSKDSPGLPKLHEWLESYNRTILGYPDLSVTAFERSLLNTADRIENIVNSAAKKMGKEGKFEIPETVFKDASNMLTHGVYNVFMGYRIINVLVNKMQGMFDIAIYGSKAWTRANTLMKTAKGKKVLKDANIMGFFLPEARAGFAAGGKWSPMYRYGLQDYRNRGRAYLMARQALLDAVKKHGVDGYKNSDFIKTARFDFIHPVARKEIEQALDVANIERAAHLQGYWSQGATQFFYTPGAMARGLRGPIAKPVFGTFQTWWMNYAWLMKHLMGTKKGLWRATKILGMQYAMYVAVEDTFGISLASRFLAGPIPAVPFMTPMREVGEAAWKLGTEVPKAVVTGEWGGAKSALSHIGRIPPPVPGGLQLRQAFSAARALGLTEPFGLERRPGDDAYTAASRIVFGPAPKGDFLLDGLASPSFRRRQKRMSYQKKLRNLRQLD